MTAKNYRNQFGSVALFLGLLALPLIGHGIAHAETEADMRRKYLKDVLKQPETMACSAHSTAILSYAEQLKEYNNMVREQLAAQGVGIGAGQMTVATPEMVAAYTNGETNILPGAETAMVNGVRVPKHFAIDDPQTVGTTLNAMVNQAMAHPQDGTVDEDGIPTAYAPFFDLSPEMRKQFRQARTMKIGPGPMIVDPTLALQEIQRDLDKKHAAYYQTGFLGRTFYIATEHGRGFISNMVYSVKKIFARQ